MNDSPVGQLARIVDKVQAWTDLTAETPDEAVDRDQLLTNVSVYWFTGSGASSAHGTYEGMRVFREMVTQQAQAPEVQQAQQPAPPMGVAVFAADTTIRGVMDPKGQIEHWSEFDRGGHFAAMEVPDLLAGDLRAFFRRHR